MESAYNKLSDVDSLKIIVFGKTEQDNIKNSTTNPLADNFSSKGCCKKNYTNTLAHSGFLISFFTFLIYLAKC